MKYDYQEKQHDQCSRKNSTLITFEGIAVQLVFAEKQNSEVPKIVGSILKGAYLQHQSV